MKCTLRELIDTRETSLIPSPQDKYRESRMQKPIPSVSNNSIRRSSKSAKKGYVSYGSQCRSLIACWESWGLVN
jgi:hypothetical protein